MFNCIPKGTSRVLHPFTLAFSMAMLSLTTQAAEVSLSVKVDGTGTVVSADGTMSCNAECRFQVADTAELLFAPTDAGKAMFIGWENGSCDFGHGAIFNAAKHAVGYQDGGAKTIYPADIDGDGHLDAVTIGLFSDSISWRHNDGGGQFGNESLVGSLSYPSAVVAVDWDADGDQDVIAAAFNNNGLYVFSNNGLGSFSAAQPITLSGIRPYSVAVADVNNDSHLDLLVSSFGANTSGDLSVLERSISTAKLAWYLNDGANHFTESAMSIGAIAAITLTAADMDKDGDLDAVAALIREDKSVWLENNNGLFGALHTITASDGVYGVAAGDLDSDGDSDVVTASYWSRSLSYSINNGDGSFAPAVSVGAHIEGVSGAAVGDINGDGRSDILSGEFNAKNFFWYANDSVLQCGLRPKEVRTITAHFNASTPPPPEQPASSSGGGGGGAVYVLGAVLALLACGRRRLAKRA